MIAADIGEAARRDPHAIEPVLVEAVRGGLDGEVGHAFTRELIERAVQRDRIRRGERAVDLARRRNEPDGADARRLITERAPDLPCEGSNGSLSTGAGNGDYFLRLTFGPDGTLRAWKHFYR